MCAGTFVLVSANNWSHPAFDIGSCSIDRESARRTLKDEQAVADLETAYQERSGEDARVRDQLAEIKHKGGASVAHGNLWWIGKCRGEMQGMFIIFVSVELKQTTH